LGINLDTREYSLYHPPFSIAYATLPSKFIDRKVKVCFLTASEIYYERFRNEEEFNEIDKDLSRLKMKT
jgi:hypothetical protein